MGSYQAPANVAISCSWQCHKDRNPPSSEPGTDYATAYGTGVACAGAGTVIDIKSSNSSATGRYVTIGLDDGNTVRYLHLSQIKVGWGQRVARGQIIALSGASGNGSDWYYGPHVHTTLWIGAAWATPTVDFQLYVGDGDMLTPDDKQIIKDSMFEFFRDVNGPPAGYDQWPFMKYAVWEAPIAAQNPDGTTQVDEDGKPVTYAAWGYLSSTNTAAHTVVDALPALEGSPTNTRSRLLYLLAALGALGLVLVAAVIGYLVGDGGAAVDALTAGL